MNRVLLLVTVVLLAAAGAFWWATPHARPAPDETGNPPRIAPATAPADTGSVAATNRQDPPTPSPIRENPAVSSPPQAVPADVQPITAAETPSRGLVSFAEAVGRPPDFRITIANERGALTIPADLPRSGTIAVLVRSRLPTGETQRTLRGRIALAAGNDSVTFSEVVAGNDAVAGTCTVRFIKGILTLTDRPDGLDENVTGLVREAARTILPTFASLVPGTYPVGGTLSVAGTRFLVARAAPEAVLVSQTDEADAARERAITVYPIEALRWDDIAIPCTAAGRPLGFVRTVATSGVGDPDAPGFVVCRTAVIFTPPAR